MGDKDQPSDGPGRDRGLEAVVRLYISRPSRESGRKSPDLVEDLHTHVHSGDEGARAEARFREEARLAAEAAEGCASEPSPDEIEIVLEEEHRDAAPVEGRSQSEHFETTSSTGEGEPAAQHRDATAGEGLPEVARTNEPAELPASSSQGDTKAPPSFTTEAGSTERDPSDTVTRTPATGSEDHDARRHASTEQQAERVDSRTEPRSMDARVVLALAAAPPGMRRALVECLASPLTVQGRRVMLVETDPPDVDSGLFEQALGLDVALLRRWLGASTREILLMPAVDRKSLFTRLATDERRAEMVVMDLGLPESVFSSRLQFLVDIIVVAITPRDSSLYEAYRSLQGLPEKRPDLTPFVIPFARTREEAKDLHDRFGKIVSDFLGLPVAAGGWIEIPGLVVKGSAPGGEDTCETDDTRSFPESSGLSLALVRTLTADPSSRTAGVNMLREAGRSFFDHLSEWFGPVVP